MIQGVFCMLGSYESATLKGLIFAELIFAESILAELIFCGINFREFVIFEKFVELIFANLKILEDKLSDFL